MTSYKMFLDDERYPTENTGTWEIVRSSQQAIDLVKESGAPVFVSFDHDLGGDDTSIVFINWLIDQLLEGNLKLPDAFGYTVHSQNPIGSANIVGKMNAILSHLGGSHESASLP